MELQELSTARQLQAINAGDLDIGVGRNVREKPTGVSCQTLGFEPLVVVAPKGHRLAHRKRIHLAELRADPFVLLAEPISPVLHRAASDLFLHSRFSPRVAMEAQQWITVIGLVEAGVGVSIVPASFARLKLSGTVFLRLQADAPTTRITLSLPVAGATPTAARLAAILQATFGG